MIYEHDFDFVQAALAVKDSIKELYEKFYSSKEEFSGNVWVNGRTCSVRSYRDYSLWQVVYPIDDEGKNYISYTIDFKKEEIHANSWQKSDHSNKILRHSEYLNSPYKMSCDFDGTVFYTSYAYFDKLLQSDEMAEYFKMYTVDIANMSNADFFSFCMHFKIGGF